jgi:hypothetical protein
VITLVDPCGPIGSIYRKTIDPTFPEQIYFVFDEALDGGSGMFMVPTNDDSGDVFYDFELYTEDYLYLPLGQISSPGIDNYPAICSFNSWYAEQANGAGDVGYVMEIDLEDASFIDLAICVDNCADGFLYTGDDIAAALTTGQNVLGFLAFGFNEFKYLFDDENVPPEMIGAKVPWGFKVREAGYSTSEELTCVLDIESDIDCSSDSSATFLNMGDFELLNPCRYGTSWGPAVTELVVQEASFASTSPSDGSTVTIPLPVLDTTTDLELTKGFTCD